MNERELLLDCLRRLNRSRVVYYLTGSMASNYWGIPRTTHDLDFVVQLPPPAATRIIQEFSGDFYIDEEAVQAAQQPPYQFNAVDTRSALKVDFWLARAEPFDQEMLRRRVQVTLSVSPRQLLPPKMSFCISSFGIGFRLPIDNWGTRQALLPCKQMRWTRNYLRRWAQELNLTAEVELLLSGQIKPKNT